jgi:hypothetical protein
MTNHLHMNAIKTTHNLDFESAPYATGIFRFRIGTCSGQWGSCKDCYYIMSVFNEEPGNGHLEDVFEWFEYSCERDHRNLLVLYFLNDDFYDHLIEKRSFIPLDKKGENVIKIFNKKAYKKLLKKGNDLLEAGTLKLK